MNSTHLLRAENAAGCRNNVPRRVGRVLLRMASEAPEPGRDF